MSEENNKPPKRIHHMKINHIFVCRSDLLAKQFTSNIMQNLIDKFAEGAVAETEKLYKEMIARGYGMGEFTIGVSTEFDEKTYTMNFKCWPITKIMKAKDEM